MRKYRAVQTTEYLCESVVCNRCGDQMGTTGYKQGAEVLVWDLPADWEVFSLCIVCCRELASSFKHPVIQGANPQGDEVNDD